MYIICVVILGILIVANIISCRYQKDFLKKDGSKELKMPLALWIVDKFKIADNANNKIKSELANLSIYKDVDNVVRMHYCKKISLCIAIIMAVDSICVFNYVNTKVNGENKDNYVKKIERPDYGENDKDLDLKVKIDDESEEEVTINVKARKLNSKERKELVEDVKRYITKEVIGENTDDKHITKKLNLVTSYPKDENIEIGWVLDNRYIDENGYVENIDKNVKIVAVIDYFEYECKYKLALHICEHNNIENDEICTKIKKDIQNQNENSGESTDIILPDSVEKTKVDFVENQEETDDSEVLISLLVITIISIIAIYVLKDREISKKMEDRKESLLLEYPKLLNKFAMLLSAGFTVKKAWIKICYEYKIENDEKYIEDKSLQLEDFEKSLKEENEIQLKDKKQKKKLKKKQKKEQKRLQNKRKNLSREYIYEEMLYTLKEMYEGKSEIDAYEDFGKRVGLIQYVKVASIFIQNIVSGVRNIVNVLEIEALEAQKEKKECIKQYGEKIGTKMLAPIVGLLVITLIIIVVPCMFVSL